MPDLKSKTLKQLQAIGKKLNIVGVYHFSKEELIGVITLVTAETKPKTEAPKATDPISILIDQLKRDRETLKSARKDLYNQTTEQGIESAKNTIMAEENKVRMTKQSLKAARKEAREDSDFSWGALLGISALVLAAAGAGVGAAVLLDNGAEAEGSTNGDSL